MFRVERLHPRPGEGHDGRESCEGLQITVVSTTVPATLSALRRAGELAYELEARIRIVVPQIVPYPLPLNRPPADPSFKTKQFRTVTINGAVETTIDVVLCRDAVTAATQVVGPESIVLIGGHKRWWPSAAQKLAQRLREAGNHVIFVPER